MSIPTPIIEQPGGPDPNDLHYWRGEACAIIRRELWQGSRPPQRGWHMGRECTIFTQLARQYTPEEVWGAYAVARECLGPELPPGPVDGRIFNVKNRRDRLARCVAHWRRLVVEAGSVEEAVMRIIGSVTFGGSANGR